MNSIKAPKKWSTQNRTCWTHSYAYVVWFTCKMVWAQDNNFNLTMRVISLDLGTSAVFLLSQPVARPSPTSSFDHLQYEVNDGFIYPDPILHNCLGTIAYHCHPLGDCQYRNTASEQKLEVGGSSGMPRN